MQATQYPSSHTSLYWHVNKSTEAAKLAKKQEKLSLEPAFGLSILGFCRNMVVQYGSSVEEDLLSHSKVLKPDCYFHYAEIRT